MTESNNPVARLYEILKEARLKPDTHHYRNVLADIFGNDPKDQISMHRNAVDMINLVEDAEASVKQLQDVNREHYLEAFPAIRATVSHPNLVIDWGKLKSRLDDVVMLKLQLAANAASLEMGEAIITDENLAKLQAEVEALENRAAEADLSEELETVVIEHLESVRQAILAYRIKGTKGLRQVLKSTMGMMIFYQPEIQAAMRQDEKKKKFFFDVASLVGNICQAASFGLQVATALGVVLPPLLESGG